jgi:hypothetical protein
MESPWIKNSEIIFSILKNKYFLFSKKSPPLFPKAPVIAPVIAPNIAPNIEVLK